VTTFFVTLTNCDLNMYNHIPYKPLQDCDYSQKHLTKQPFYARIKVPIVWIFTWIVLSSTMHYKNWRRLRFLHVLTWQFTSSLSSLTISLCILSTRFFWLRFFCFLGKFAYLLFVCIRKLFFSFQLDSLLLVCTTWTQSNTNITQKNYNLQKPYICFMFPLCYGLVRTI